jgi:hypothetical protein
MTALLLLHSSGSKILVGHSKMICHLSQRLVTDALEADLLLSLCQQVPELAPNGIAGSGAEQFLHFRAAVAGVQGRLHVVSDRAVVMGYR